MSFRVLNQAPVYLLATGKPAAGGSLETFESDLSTPKVTYSDPGLTTPNPTTILLDAAGRTVTDVWSDGELGVVLKDALGVTQWTRNNVRDGDAGGPVIPADVPDTFLFTDGTTRSWQSVLQVPDPTGLANYQLVSDGTAVPIWQQIPEPPEPPAPEYDVQAGFIRIGTLLQAWGTGTAPADAAAKTSSVNIVFAQAFSATPYHASVTITNSGGSTPSGAICTLAVTSLTTTGMTVTVNMPDDDTNSSWKLANATPFSYFVVGPTVLPP